MAYLDLAGFKALSTIPDSVVDAIESAYAGWVDGQLTYWSAWIDSRLSKRYAAPFASPYPVAVTGWLARMVTLRVYLKRGVDATDEQFITIQEEAKAAETEVMEAAEAVEGLFDLPLRADTTSTGIARGATFVYSEASPYVGRVRRRRAGRSEDSRGGGSFG